MFVICAHESHSLFTKTTAFNQRERFGICLCLPSKTINRRLLRTEEGRKAVYNQGGPSRNLVEASANAAAPQVFRESAPPQDTAALAPTRAWMWKQVAAFVSSFYGGFSTRGSGTQPRCPPPWCVLLRVIRSRCRNFVGQVEKVTRRFWLTLLSRRHNMFASSPALCVSLLHRVVFARGQRPTTNLSLVVQGWHNEPSAVCWCVMGGGRGRGKHTHNPVTAYIFPSGIFKIFAMLRQV